MAGHCRPPCPLNGRSIRSCIIESISDIENNQDSNDNIIEDGVDDKENELPDENANYHGNEAESNITEKSYFEEIYNLEAMTNHTE